MIANTIMNIAIFFLVLFAVVIGFVAVALSVGIIIGEIFDGEDNV